jgi:hypothetical protein
MSFWDVMWFIVLSFMLMACLMVLFAVLSDRFRDPDTSGLVKAIRVVFLVLLPLITSLVHLVARGRKMMQLDAERFERQSRDQAAYIREVADQGTPTEELVRVREMFDAGLVSQPKFERLKAKALV